MHVNDNDLKKRLPPLDALSRLREAALRCGKKTIKPSRAMLYPGRTHSVFFVLNGTVEIIQQLPYRTLGVIVEMIPIGLIELHYPRIDLGYKLNSHSEILEIKHADWEEYIVENNLQSAIIAILIYMSFAALIQIEEIFTQENLEKIKNIIYKANRLNAVHPMDTPLSQFILERTDLSRSLVMRVLSDLRNTGYIELINGRLVRIIKEL